MEFDYIIIGSGAVGSSLAYQLSKNNKSLALVDIAKTKKPKIKRRYKALLSINVLNLIHIRFLTFLEAIQNYGQVKYI